MDSLLANYASSDDEDDQQNPPPPATVAPRSTAKSLFSSMPPPKPSSSALFSLPPPKSHLPKPPANRYLSDDDLEDLLPVNSGKPSSLFSAIPQPKASSSLLSSLPLPLPKAQDAGPAHPPPTAAPEKKKKVIQLKPPVLSSDEEDDDEEEEQRKRRKNQSSWQTSWSAIPAPKNSATLGSSTLGSGSGTSRRSIIDADVPGLKKSATESTAEAVINSAVIDQGSVSMSGASDASYGSDYSGWAPGADENYAGASAGESYAPGVAENYGDYASYSGDQGNYANYEQHQSYQIEELGPEISMIGGSGGFKVPGKRGRNNVPVEMVEVKQDELMKNRPREDQSKLTGIAFGPSYAPASTKGKPNKLHKRKHQIGTLYYDMKSKETELAERRAKGFQTKAQTQGKYGW